MWTRALGELAVKPCRARPGDHREAAVLRPSRSKTERDGLGADALQTRNSHVNAAPARRDPAQASRWRPAGRARRSQSKSSPTRKHGSCRSAPSRMAGVIARQRADDQSLSAQGGHAGGPHAVVLGESGGRTPAHVHTACSPSVRQAGAKNPGVGVDISSRSAPAGWRGGDRCPPVCRCAGKPDGYERRSPRTVAAQ